MDLLGDNCPQEKICSSFSTEYTPVTSIKVTEEDDYCIHLCHNSSWENIGVSLSDMSGVILNRETLQKVSSFSSHQKPITGIRFSPTNNHLVWTSSLDGTVKIWDIRSEKCERIFETTCDEESDDIYSSFKPLTSFDISLNERILCAGTELVQGNAFLLFWDIRNEKSLGGYMDSHSNDVTQVKFHPEQSDTLATASTDSLINVFDISQSEESDALTYSLNADVTVDKLTWLKTHGRYERLAAVTDIHSVQYWDIKEAAPMYNFTREEITNSIKRQAQEESYVVSVDMLHDSDDPIILLGSGMDNSKCLRTVRLNLSKGKLLPEGALLNKQEQRMARAALYEAKMDSYITAGECGVVRAWKPVDNSMITKHSTTKSKSHRIKPY